MNSQNILKFWGSKFDLKLDTSEFHDYEVGKTEVDYNTEVLDLTTPIVYSSLKINTTLLMGTLCSRDRITLVEYDNRFNDPTYPYSAYTWTLLYSDFTTRLGNSDTILHNDVYEFVDNSGFTHYFRTLNYNSPLSNPFSLNVTGLTVGTPIACIPRLWEEDHCCPIDSPSNAKPWAYQTNHGAGSGNDCNPIIRRRTEKGWTLDFVFNREELPWSVGKVFYYLGTRGDSSISDYADNNLSFSFTSDRRIQWRAVHYSGACSDDGVYGQSYYIASGQTPQLCIDGTSEDFEITITFDRYRHLTDCNIENDGGWNDLIPEHIVNDYVPNTGVTAVTSTQIAVHNTVELLNKKWADERNRRLGILKIYLNGRPVYKIKDWEEIIPSTRGVQPFIQSWGAGTQYSGGIHNMGISCFNFKRIQYYEEPLDFVHVRHHYLVDTKPHYNIIECVDDCPDEVIGLGYTVTPTPTPTLTRTPTPTIPITTTPTPTMTPTFNVDDIIITIVGGVSSGSVIVNYVATASRPVSADVLITGYNHIYFKNDSEYIQIPFEIQILSGQTTGNITKTQNEYSYYDLDVNNFEFVQISYITSGNDTFTLNTNGTINIFDECSFEASFTQFYINNDLVYDIIPDGNFIYSLIPNNDLTYTLIPSGDFSVSFIPDNDVTYVTLPNNDIFYSIIPNNDTTYTLIPNNDLEYSVLRPPAVFYGEITLGEDSVEGTCNCPVGECPRFYVTGDGPTFCESNIFIITGGGTFFNGWGTIVHNGFYKTVNMDGTNIATYRTDCGTCPSVPTPTPTETPTPTPTETPTPTPTPTETPITSSPYSYTIQARAIDGSNNKYGWVIQQDACEGGEFNVTIYSNSSTFVDGMNFYSDINASGINDIVTYMEYYYYYPLENKTFRLLSGNVAGEIASCPTPTETPTPTPTSTMVPYNKIVDLNINDSISYSGSGTTVTDILGNTNAYLSNVSTRQNDGCNSSIVLNGNDQYIITTTSIQSFYDSTDTSLFLWVYLTDNGVILSEQGGGGLNFNWHDSQIELVNGTLKFTVWPYNGIITSSISTPLNNWYYIGFVYNNTTLTAYVNGQSAGSSTVVRQVPYENGHGLYYAIGAPDSTNLGDGSYSALKFGRLEIWDGAISSSDVLQNYNDSVTTWICPTPTPTNTPTPTITSTPTPTPTSTSTPTPTPTSGLIVTISEVGSDVIMSGSGSLNLTGLIEGSVQSGWGINGTLGTWVIGPSSSFFGRKYQGNAFSIYPTSFGSGYTAPTSFTGDAFGIQNGSLGKDIIVPIGYTSGSPLSGTATFANKTISSMGLTPGTYLYDWGSDSITLQIGS
jgi:hypothetical protein